MRLRLPTALEDYLDELSTIPASAKDDLVDSTTRALNYLRQRPVDDAVFRLEDIERAFTDDVEPLFPKKV
jgi:hypothetical protein